MGDNAAVRAILEDVCRITNMGFAAVAHVTEARWIACQVVDKIEFGLDPGSELDIKTTICDDVRRNNASIVIDNVSENIAWSTHPTPIIYGFKSYVSLPIYLEDGSFFGTLCAIDPSPRMLSGSDTIAALQDFARKLTALLSKPSAA